LQENWSDVVTKTKPSIIPANDMEVTL